MVFVIGGTLLVIINHIVRNILRQKKGEFKAKHTDKKVGLIGSIAIIVVGVALLVTAIIILANSETSLRPIYTGFTVGLMILVIAISILLGLGISVPKFIDASKKQEIINE